MSETCQFEHEFSNATFPCGDPAAARITVRDELEVQMGGFAPDDTDSSETLCEGHAAQLRSEVREFEWLTIVADQPISDDPVST